MRSRPTFLRFLQVLPAAPVYLRLSIFFGSFLICGVFMILGLMVTNNRGMTPIFAIPVALAAWMFRPRQATFAIGGIFLMLIIINSVTVKSLFWPLPLFIAFLCSIVASVIVALTIIVLRHALNAAELARQQSKQAEKQILTAYKQEQHLNELKDQLLLSINHELRTPLTSLHGYLQLLQHPRLDSTKQSRLVYEAIESSNELVRMVNTILDASRYENTPLAPHLETLPVAPIVYKAIELFEPGQWKSHPISLQIDGALRVRADYQFFHQILWNLFSNACKYSPEKSPITIGAQMDRTASTQPAVCIWIQDEGLGIAPEEVPTLFRKFVRLQRDQVGSIRGTGLGLYICKQLVEAMGGRIWVESSGVEGEGSRFYFTLPSASPSF